MSRVCHGLRAAHFQLLFTLHRFTELLALMHFLMPDHFPLNADFEPSNVIQEAKIKELHKIKDDVKVPQTRCD